MDIKYNFEDFVIDDSDLPADYSRIPFVKDTIKGRTVYNPIVKIPPSLSHDEIFRPITDVVVRNVMSNRYWVSNYGRLWDALYNKFVALHFDKAYKPNGHNDGYVKASLSYYTDPYTIKNIDVLMHRIVMIVFCYFKGCEAYTVNHKNGDCADFRLTNLEWMTSEENIKHAALNNFIYGKPLPTFNFTDDDYHRICKLIQGGLLEYEIFDATLYPMSAINMIRCGLIKNHITDQYNLGARKLQNKSSKINEQTVRGICAALERGDSPTDIAIRFDVGRHIVNDIKFGRNYTYISKEYNIVLPPPQNTTPPMTIHKICKMLENGIDKYTITNELGISPNIVGHVKYGKTGKEISRNYNISKPKQYVKVTRDIIRQICELLQSKQFTDVEIADKFDISFNIVRDVRLRYSYKDISKDYDF